MSTHVVATLHFLIVYVEDQYFLDESSDYIVKICKTNVKELCTSCLISPRQAVPRAMYVESNDLVPRKNGSGVQNGNGFQKSRAA
jgi:hypothetical protein